MPAHQDSRSLGDLFNDLAQDAVVVGLGRLGSFEMRGTDSLERYFKRVLRSLAIDQGRRAARRAVLARFAAFFAFKLFRFAIASILSEP